MGYPFVLPRGDHGAGSRKIRWLAQVSWWGAAVFSDQLVELLEVGEAGFRRDGLDAQIRVPEQLFGPAEALEAVPFSRAHPVFFAKESDKMIT